MLQFPRESVEYLPLDVKLDGVATEDYDVSVVESGERPDTFAPGPYLIDGLDVGEYSAWVQITDTPEAPVLGPFSFRIT